MRDWNKPAERDEAFRIVIAEAIKNEDVRKALLDPKTAKNTVETRGEIKLPDEMEVVFHRQEDLPSRLVMLIPADPAPEHQPSYPPGFDSCFKCTWITYRDFASEEQKTQSLERSPEIEDL